MKRLPKNPSANIVIPALRLIDFPLGSLIAPATLTKVPPPAIQRAAMAKLPRFVVGNDRRRLGGFGDGVDSERRFLTLFNHAFAAFCCRTGAHAKSNADGLAS